MKFKKLSLDESLFNEDWTTTPEFNNFQIPKLDPSAVFDEYDDDFSDIEGEPSISDRPLPGPKPGTDTGIASMLIDAINDEWSTIDKYNSIIATLTSLNADEHMGDVVVFQDIIAEEHKHVGQIQELLKRISPNTTEIKKGESEAQRQFNFVDGKLPVQVMEPITTNNYPSSQSSNDPSIPNAIDEYCSILDVDDDM